MRREAVIPDSKAAAAQHNIHPWKRLLEETRQALTELRSSDLEELAARAQCMLDAMAGDSPVRQRIPALASVEVRHLDSEQHLLGALLLATEGNLRVLERTQEREDARWVL